LETSDGSVREANPLAALILERYSWWGMSCFKLACTGTGLLAVGVVTRFRPRLGYCLLLSFCASLVVVSGYSSVLLVVQPWTEEESQLQAIEQRRLRDMDQHTLDIRGYVQLRERLGQDLLARRQTLPEATAELTRYVLQINYDPLSLLCDTAGERSTEANVAAELVYAAALDAVLEPLDGTTRRLRSLAREFETQYHAALPNHIMELLKEKVLRKPRPRRGGRFQASGAIGA
jgi:hypothetical protein